MNLTRPRTSQWTGRKRSSARRGRGRRRQQARSSSWSSGSLPKTKRSPSPPEKISTAKSEERATLEIQFEEPTEEEIAQANFIKEQEAYLEKGYNDAMNLEVHHDDRGTESRNRMRKMLECRPKFDESKESMAGFIARYEEYWKDRRNEAWNLCAYSPSGVAGQIIDGRPAPPRLAS